MLLRSSSTPALKNLVGQCCLVPEIDASPTTSHVSPKYSPLRHSTVAAVSLKRTSSEGDLKLLSPMKGKSKQQTKDGTSPHHYSQLRPPSSAAAIAGKPVAPLQRASSEGELKLLPNMGISSIEEAARSVVASGGGDGGFSSGGGGGGEEIRVWSNGGGGGGRLPPQGTEFMDKYYRDMITMYPGDGLLLSNYAKFLKDTRGDAARAEEYCERAILVNAGDGGILSMYGDLIWNNHRDGGRANSYFNQAVKSSPGDCHVLASYARFLWDVAEEGEEDEEEEEEEEDDDVEEEAQQFPPQSRPKIQAQQTAHSFAVGFGTPLGFPPLTAYTT